MSLNKLVLKEFFRRVQISSFREVGGQRIVGNEFGSINRSDIPIEKPLRPRRPVGDIQKHKAVKQLYLKPIATKLPEIDSSDTIECSNTQFNKTIIENGSIRLFTKHWEKNKYKNQWIRFKKTTKQAKNSVDISLNSWENYVPDLLHPGLIQTLISMKCHRPTELQSRMLRYILSPHHIFMAAETGSGKTIAYGVSIITQLAKNIAHNHKAVVVTATTLLANQITEVLHDLARSVSVNVKNASNKDKEESWDILVGTPGLVAKALQKSPTEKIIHLVFDEADVLLDTSFINSVSDILSLIPVAHSETNANKSSGAKVIFCSASCPEELEVLAEGVVDRRYLSYVRSYDLHKLGSAVDITLIRMREMDKINHLAELISKDMLLGELNQSIVFCKNNATANFVTDKLISSGFKAVLWEKSTAIEDIHKARVIVATDSASRGIDLPRLNHVIQYDMAKYVVDFLHRCGRVGRLSSNFPCRVTAFVRTPQEVNIATKIEASARCKKPLQFIETDIGGMIDRTKEQEE